MGEKPFTVLDVPQRSAEWYQARLGRLTGSCAGDMLATIKTGEAATRRNLRLRLVLERLTNKSQESTFISAAMQSGIDREADAVAAYEAQSGVFVERTGFLVHPSLMAGCSLDGHVDDFDILVSVKCRQPAAHWEFLRYGKVPADAWAQMRHELWMTEALEHHYVSWNPDFPENKQLRIRTFKRDEMDISSYDVEARGFLEGVDTEMRALDGFAVVKGVA